MWRGIGERCGGTRLADEPVDDVVEARPGDAQPPHLFDVTGFERADTPGVVAVRRDGGQNEASRHEVQREAFDRVRHRLSLWNRRTDNGKKIAIRTSGHTTAISVACCSTQLPLSHVGFPNSSRDAETVADNGFHSAIVPSQP